MAAERASLSSTCSLVGSSSYAMGTDRSQVLSHTESAVERLIQFSLPLESSGGMTHHGIVRSQTRWPDVKVLASEELTRVRTGFRIPSALAGAKIDLEI